MDYNQYCLKPDKLGYLEVANKIGSSVSYHGAHGEKRNLCVPGRLRGEYQTGPRKLSTLSDWKISQLSGDCFAFAWGEVIRNHSAAQPSGGICRYGSCP